MTTTASASVPFARSTASDPLGVTPGPVATGASAESNHASAVEYPGAFATVEPAASAKSVLSKLGALGTPLNFHFHY